jgi:hypothetical protein
MNGRKARARRKGEVLPVSFPDFDPLVSIRVPTEEEAAGLDGMWRAFASLDGAGGDGGHEGPVCFSDPGCDEHGSAETWGLVARYVGGERFAQPVLLSCGCRYWVGAEAEEQMRQAGQGHWLADSG